MRYVFAAYLNGSVGGKEHYFLLLAEHDITRVEKDTPQFGWPHSIGYDKAARLTSPQILH